jgi:hypothetical protein
MRIFLSVLCDKTAPADISVAFKPLQAWASSLCVSRMGQICVANNWGVDMIEVGGTVSCCNVSWHGHIITCLNENLTRSLVTARSVLLCYKTAEPSHCSLSFSCSSQAVWLGRYNNVTWRTAAVLRCAAGVMYLGVLQVWCTAVCCRGDVLRCAAGVMYCGVLQVWCTEVCCKCDVLRCAASVMYW